MNGFSHLAAWFYDQWHLSLPPIEGWIFKENLISDDASSWFIFLMTDQSCFMANTNCEKVVSWNHSVVVV